MARIRVVIVAVLVASACSLAGESEPPVVVGESVADDFAALADDVVESFAAVAPAAAACMGEVSLEAEPDLDDLARYDQRTATIWVRVPATAASLEGSLVHELAHHLEVSCPSHASFRPTFLASQGLSRVAAWFAADTWAETPSEQYAEAVVEVVTGERHRSQLEIRLTPEAIAVTRSWLQGEA